MMYMVSVMGSTKAVQLDQRGKADFGGEYWQGENYSIAGKPDW